MQYGYRMVMEDKLDSVYEYDDGIESWFKT